MRHAGLSIGVAVLAAVLASCGGKRHAAPPPAPSRTAAAPPATAAHAPRAQDRTELWPTYGVDAQRRGVARGTKVRPPFRIAWVLDAGSLIEFPPVIAYSRLYLGTNHGRFVAVAPENGRIVWRREFGRCIAAAAAASHRVVYVSLMGASPCSANTDGFLVALRAETGRELWRFRAGPIESSPLVSNGVVYVGSWDRHLYAIDAASGHASWAFATGDKVKGGAALAYGTVYFGSYDGRLYALDARTGHLRWSADAGASIYATPSIANGRVFVGTLGGAISAFDARTGRLLWKARTGSYVYSSAAVWRGSVYAGSYDHRLYALDAAAGRVLWSFAAPGPVSGTPTVVAGLVYFATCAVCIAGQTRLGTQRTYALDARTGRIIWTFPRGNYTPLVADAARAYLVGYQRLFGLVPR
jgi:outer membrane protein assembly factor BamB